MTTLTTNLIEKTIYTDSCHSIFKSSMAPDRAHDWKHINTVINSSQIIAAKAGLDPVTAAAIAFYHDSGLYRYLIKRFCSEAEQITLLGDLASAANDDVIRKQHHKMSALIVSHMSSLNKILESDIPGFVRTGVDFSKVDIDIVGDAVLHHRHSGEQTSVWHDLARSADSLQPACFTVYRSAVYNMSHNLGDKPLILDCVDEKAGDILFLKKLEKEFDGGDELYNMMKNHITKKFLSEDRKKLPICDNLADEERDVLSWYMSSKDACIQGFKDFLEAALPLYNEALNRW